MDPALAAARAAEIAAHEARFRYFATEVRLRDAQMCRVIARGDLGPSFKYANRSVNEIIAQKLPVSLELGGWAMLVALGLGLALGAISRFVPLNCLSRLSLGDFQVGRNFDIVAGRYAVAFLRSWFGHFSPSSPFIKSLPL